VSNFKCEKCGVACIDSPQGYTTGCEHYPSDMAKKTNDIDEIMTDESLIRKPCELCNDSRATPFGGECQECKTSPVVFDNIKDAVVPAVGRGSKETCTECLLFGVGFEVCGIPPTSRELICRDDDGDYCLRCGHHPDCHQPKASEGAA